MPRVAILCSDIVAVSLFSVRSINLVGYLRSLGCRRDGSRENDDS